MSGVERILGVQALVSQWTCKLRDDEVVPIHGSRPNGQNHRETEGLLVTSPVSKGGILPPVLNQYESCSLL